MDGKASLPSQGISNLPTELHIQILSYLTDSIISQVSASRVCRLWKSIILNDPYFQNCRYMPVQINNLEYLGGPQINKPEMIAVHKIFGLTRILPGQPTHAFEIRCKFEGEKVVACHYIRPKPYYAFEKEYDLQQPPDDEPDTWDILHSEILDEKCFRDISVLQTAEREWNSEIPQMDVVGSLEEFVKIPVGMRYICNDICKTIGRRLTAYIYFLRKGGMTIRQLFELVVEYIVEKMEKIPYYDPRVEQYLYLSMQRFAVGRENFEKYCGFRVMYCHPDALAYIHDDACQI